MGTGHIFEIDGHSITNYKKGDYVFWKGSTIPYGYSNIGLKTRYTCPDNRTHISEKIY